LTFNSLSFLFLFFPLFFILYYFANDRLKNYWLLAASILFFSWGSPKVLFFILISCCFDYIVVILLARFSHNIFLKKMFASFGIFANVCLLGYFKYANFFIAEFNRLVAAIGLHQFSWTAVILPIGISFITFKKISYIVDIFRHTEKPARTFADYLIYVVLFPQIMAGPIVKYHEISKQIQNRTHRLELFFQGIFRFSLGLGKKVLIADVLGEIANGVFAISPVSLPALYAWLGAVCYTFQIYFDFSGYTDMAIGLGNMMGFTCPENFNLPYISRNITEFWRRWHITLSLWMREYLYIPLGGNRVSKVRIYLNLWIVFLFSGLWHGANWTFIAWGAYHGLFITLDKLFWQKIAMSMNKTISISINFVIIMFGWVLFRSPDISYAIKYSLRMLGMSAYEHAQTPILWHEFITNKGMFVLFVAALFSFCPALKSYDILNNLITKQISKETMCGLKFATLMLLCILSFLFLSTANFNTFIYFKF